MMPLKPFPFLSGVNCEINIDECAVDPCENGATCVDGINDFVCECVPGFEGRNCQVNIDECEVGFSFIP